jgi:hypothetical protein
VQLYSAKKANWQPSMVTLPHLPVPCMLIKSAVPLMQSDVQTLTSSGQLAGFPGHQFLLLSLP